ncbi:MAG: hypothetical protein ACRD0P_28185, partial [Stackebrandtia sp.]
VQCRWVVYLLGLGLTWGFGLWAWAVQRPAGPVGDDWWRVLSGVRGPPAGRFGGCSVWLRACSLRGWSGALLATGEL